MKQHAEDYSLHHCDTQFALASCAHLLELAVQSCVSHQQMKYTCQSLVIFHSPVHMFVCNVRKTVSRSGVPTCSLTRGSHCYVLPSVMAIKDFDCRNKHLIA